MAQGSAWRRPTTWCAAAGAAVTAFVVFSPFIRLAYRLPGLHMVVDTVSGVTGLLVAYLLFGRFRLSGRSTDLTLAGALTLGAFADLFLLAIPAAGLESRARVFSAWAPAGARVLVAVAIAYAAFSTVRTLTPTRRHALALVGGAAAVTATVALVVAILSPSLPAGTDPDVTGAGSRPDLNAHAAVLAVQVVAMGLFGAAAVRFDHRARREDDDLLEWISASVALSAFARLNYFLFPSLYSEWVSLGDLLRMAAKVVLLVGAAREIRLWWERHAEAAVGEERRRLARDLHDGMAQELSLLAQHAQLLAAGNPRPDTPERMSTAAQRALDEARLAIHALDVPEPGSLDGILRRTATDVGDRHHVRLVFDVDRVPDAPLAVVSAFSRIAREAIVNASRHGGARTVQVTLRAEDGYLLRVADDGSGYRSESARPSGLGLVGMRERAEALGGYFTIQGSESGTEVEVWVPKS